MTFPRSVAVTGATGRLGRALMDALEARAIPAYGWSRPEYDLDDPGSGRRLVDRDRPDLVIHAAAWTDVDGCARSPERAMRRNGSAVGELAAACVAAGAALVVISTNEVFDGGRTDGLGYREDDPTGPPNPYGASKLAGEHAAQDAYRSGGALDGLTIVRTAWLFGPPGNDFPTKIIAAADRLPDGKELEVVHDEVGSPTFTRDLAAGLLDLIGVERGGVYHLVNGGVASRFDVATAVLARCRPQARVAPIGRAAFVRASVAPAWAVLDASRAAAAGVALRSWREALEDYLSASCPG